MSDDVFHSVNFESFQVGDLTERNLYLYFPNNDRYLLICNALNPIEEKTLKKIRKLGQVYSNKKSLEDRFKKFNEMLFELSEWTTEENTACFEINRKIADATSSFLELIINDEEIFDPAPIVMLMHRCFDAPSKSISLFMSDQSSDVFEKTIIRASVSAFIALWLGYYPKKFIQHWMETVFCEALSELNEIFTFKKEECISLIEKGFVPEYAPQMDARFEMMLTSKEQSIASGYCDDAIAILQYADGLIAKEKNIAKEFSHRGRIARLMETKLKSAQDRKNGSKKNRDNNKEEDLAA